MTDGRLNRLEACSQNVLQIEFLPNPDPSAIRYFRDMQLDDAGNVLGYGAEPAPNLGE